MNTRSSTEAEVVAADEAVGPMLWTRSWLTNSEQDGGPQRRLRGLPTWWDCNHEPRGFKEHLKRAVCGRLSHYLLYTGARFVQADKMKGNPNTKAKACWLVLIRIMSLINEVAFRCGMGLSRFSTKNI